MVKSKKKPTTTGKTSHPLKHEPVVISGSERNHMVSDAAYFLAEHRGFVPGDELKDWALAELEIDAKLFLKMD